MTPQSKVRLMRSQVVLIFLYACETWILTADLQRRIGAIEMRCSRKLIQRPQSLPICKSAAESVKPCDRGRKAQKGLSKIILQGTIRVGRRGRQGKVVVFFMCICVRALCVYCVTSVSTVLCACWRVSIYTCMCVCQCVRVCTCRHVSVLHCVICVCSVCFCWHVLYMCV